MQKVYENAVHCRLLYMVGCTAASGLGVIHLVYNALPVVPGRHRVYTHSLSELFGSDFGELYRSVQKVYENAAPCRLLYMVG